jgi:hypothetical protein
MLWMFSLPLQAGPSCPAVVEPNVEVSGDRLTLADLLSADTCEPLRQVAAGMRLGSAPLPGSIRVLAGAEVQQWLQSAVERTHGAVQPDVFRAPERVVVRRAGVRATCAEIRVRMAAESTSTGSDPGIKTVPLPALGSACGAEGRILQDAALDFIPPVWDVKLRQWRIVGRCAHAGDCVPFLMLLPNLASLPESLARPSIAARLAQAPSLIDHATRNPDVRTGQKVTLIWDQGGLRVVVPAVALGTGLGGEPVRVRLPNGQILPATVEGAGLLLTTSELGHDQ